MRRLLNCDPKRLAGMLAVIVSFAFPAVSETLKTDFPDQPEAESTKDSGDRRAEVDQLLKAGWALFQDHKNDEAVAAYSKAIELDSQSARAFALRA